MRIFIYILNSKRNGDQDSSGVALRDRIFYLTKEEMSYLSLLILRIFIFINFPNGNGGKPSHIELPGLF